MDKHRQAEQLSEAMTEVGDDLVREAEDHAPMKMKKKNSWVKWAAIAAAAVLMLAAVPAVILGVSGGIGGMKELETNAMAGKSGGLIREDARSDGGVPEGAMYSDGDGRSYGAPYDFGGIGAYKEISGEMPAELAPTDSCMDVEPSDKDAEDTDLPPVEEETEGPLIIIPDAQQLTAAAWNDNEHFTLWRDLFVTSGQDGATSGKFAMYTGNIWRFQTTNRLAVKVTKDGNPVAGARVSISGGTAKAVTDASGTAYLFMDIVNGKLAVESGEGRAEVEITEGASEVEIELDQAEEKENAIELMYVIDVTGSMGDEISYLKREIEDVVDQVIAANPGVKIYLSFLFYRDYEDEEDFVYVDFKDVTDEANLKAQKAALQKMDALGGGDYEEAVDDALLQAVNKQWSSGTSTKLIFHVLDAPPHDGDEYVARFTEAVNTAAEKGIRICPVLSSGADNKTEYLTRVEAILTGGTFVFLTDDSGIGGTHHDPNIIDAVHEYLNMLMIRLINGYHSGTFAEPVKWSDVQTK